VDGWEAPTVPQVTGLTPASRHGPHAYQTGKYDPFIGYACRLRKPYGGRVPNPWFEDPHETEVWMVGRLPWCLRSRASRLPHGGVRPFHRIWVQASKDIWVSKTTRVWLRNLYGCMVRKSWFEDPHEAKTQMAGRLSRCLRLRASRPPQVTGLTPTTWWITKLRIKV